MDKLPKYAVDLIRELDAEVGHINLDHFGIEAWADMTPSNTRRLAYWAGQRGLVDALVSMIDEGDDDEAGSNSPESPVAYVVRGPDGRLHRGASPPHVAEDLSGAGYDDSDRDDEDPLGR